MKVFIYGFSLFFMPLRSCTPLILCHKNETEVKKTNDKYTKIWEILNQKWYWESCKRKNAMQFITMANQRHGRSGGSLGAQWPVAPDVPVIGEGHQRGEVPGSALWILSRETVFIAVQPWGIKGGKRRPIGKYHQTIHKSVKRVTCINPIVFF